MPAEKFNHDDGQAWNSKASTHGETVPFSIQLEQEQAGSSGVILRVEKTSMYDGDGLRTVVYLKGCTLSCQWCSTPESQSYQLELGFNPSRCRSCLKCIEKCPEGAIHPGKDGISIRIEETKCTHCFTCVTTCPAGALKAYGFEKTVDEIIREVEKDEIFYFYSGGGLTLTGGEPLSQAPFVQKILHACRQRGIHTALETAGFVSWDSFELVLPLLDLLYFDLKHLDPIEHEKLTGQRNELILENLRKIDDSAHSTELIVRIPLIPGLNDSKENLIATGLFCKTLKNLKSLEVLPYHRFGVETYDFLGRQYPLKNLRSPGKDPVEEMVTVIRNCGLSVPVYSGQGGL